jgi:hypothetical protein
MEDAGPALLQYWKYLWIKEKFRENLGIHFWPNWRIIQRTTFLKNPMPWESTKSPFASWKPLFWPWWRWNTHRTFFWPMLWWGGPKSEAVMPQRRNKRGYRSSRMLLIFGTHQIKRALEDRAMHSLFTGKIVQSYSNSRTKNFLWLQLL